MSIDFATLQGLTIPEGVVTKIEDASGRVLWSAATTFEGTLYLRPSADVSFTGDKYPEDLAYGYLAISEEVADGYATYIGQKLSTNSNVYASVEGTFALAPEEKVSIKKVISGELFVKGESGYQSSDAHSDEKGIAVSITVLGVVYEFVQMNDGTGLYDGRPGTTRTFSLPDAMITVINNYVAVNGNVPEMMIYLSAKDCDHGGYDSKLSASARFDQVYLALECE